MKIMKKRIAYILPVIIMLLIPIISLCFYPWLPEKISCHWSGGPQPDACMEKGVYIFLMPMAMIIPVFMISVLGIALSVDNKAAGNLFASLSILLSSFLFFGCLLILLWNIGVKFNMGRFIDFGGGIFLALAILSTFYFSVLAWKIKKSQKAEGNHKD
jgi:uncharacterized membrane protein